MSTVLQQNPASQPPTIEILPPRRGISLDLGDLWRYRELLYFLTWRDIKVRYKQTALGVAWALLQPLLATVLFTLIFGYFLELPSGGVPYPVFTLTALLPWQLFAYALNHSSQSLVEDRNLITKIYFPRLIIPFSSVSAGLLDFAIGLIFLLVMMLVYRVPLTWQVLALPGLVAYAVLAALSVGLWLSALNVQYRDVRYTLPFLTQFWMYATPIAYSAAIIPEGWRWLACLNPMTGVVEGFRWALLGIPSPLGGLLWISVVVVLVLLVSGLYYFKRMEERFADVI